MTSLSIAAADSLNASAPSTAPITTPQQPSVWARGWAWAKGATTGTIDYTVTHGGDIVACAVDSCAVVGVGEDAAHRAQIAAPWFIRILSAYAPSYHMEKGMFYLDEAFDMIQQNGGAMPLNISTDLLTTYNQLRHERDSLQKAKQQSRRANKVWKGRVKVLLSDVRRSTEDAKTQNLMRDLGVMRNGQVPDAPITHANRTQSGTLKAYQTPSIDVETRSNLSARTNEDPFKDPEGDDVSYVERT